VVEKPAGTMSSRLPRPPAYSTAPLIYRGHWSDVRKNISTEIDAHVDDATVLGEAALGTKPCIRRAVSSTEK